ncbi:MAG: glutamine-hydrolyzing GMP synthase [Candidatus Veblenbacteria bacterium]|nr:glutamine-hydrolyzing GMP synthase [Candidatus Veblenbacteria bacterium]MDZ4229729.1 glutamine-hydrolyzing GMP synthase [Candidatus Veblenbacteria bacterium]
MLQTLTKVTPEVLAEIESEKKLRHSRELFLLFAMGSQFDHLIKMAVERLGVYCLVADPGKITAADVKQFAPTGIILSGGPASVHAEPPPFDVGIFDLGTPVLGICLGFQMWAKHIGAPVVAANRREFGVHTFTVTDPQAQLFSGCPSTMEVLESHGDRVEPGQHLTVLGHTENAVAAGHYQHLWGVQFHPEVTHTPQGLKMLENFCFGICGAKDKFPAHQIAMKKVEEVKELVKDRKVLLALSGGSDSSCVAFILKHALVGIEVQVVGVYIKGIDRPEDEAHVKKYFGSEPWLELKIVDATSEFLAALKGKESMRDKRLAMREVYRTILEQEATACGAGFIAQGTLYTDVSESAGGYTSGAAKAQIKIHHNVNLGFSVPELAPLLDQVKDTARNIGRDLEVPEELLTRHPFPGPGLVVRIEGEVTAENLTIARAADGIFLEELHRAGVYESVWQAGAVVTRSQTTCTKGDDAASGIVLALWAVTSVNGFTANWAELPVDFLRRVSIRLTNEIREVGAVVYRISDKPPATIEWG